MLDHQEAPASFGWQMKKEEGKNKETEKGEKGESAEEELRVSFEVQEEVYLKRS